MPSLRVSDWLPRFKADGFDGVELWEFHFLNAELEEQRRLLSAAPLAMYNSYVGFGDDGDEARERAARAINELGVVAVKYNLGADSSRLGEYRRNLLAWADQLPPNCRLLCECHPGTVLEKLVDGVAFFRDLDPVRFGVIAHVSGGPSSVGPWLEAFNGRIQHLHLQMRTPETDPAVASNREHLDACFETVRQHGFEGSASIEFTRGIGKNEEIERLYANACADLAYCRGVLN